MIAKGDKLYSILHFKCPYCHEGDFYTAKIYQLKHLGKINTMCPKCRRPLQKETGFYFGAMYVSYAIGVVLFVFGFVLLSALFNNMTTAVKIISIVGFMLLSAPLVHALSKIIWANLFMHYQKN